VTHCGGSRFACCGWANLDELVHEIWGFSVERTTEHLYDYRMGNGALIDAVDTLDTCAYESSIIERFQCLDRLLATIIGDLDRFDRDGMWAVCGATSLQAWLMNGCRRTRGEAAAITRMMRLTRSLPVTADAFADGSLAKGHVEVIGANVRPETMGAFAEIEPELVPQLAELSIRDATTAMKQWAAHANAKLRDSDGNPPPEVERDRLQLSELLDGTHVLDGVLTGENAVIVKAALARCTPDPVPGEPLLSQSQRNALALVEMANIVLQVTDTTVRRSTDVMLLLPADTYLHGGPAQFSDGTIVAPERVKRLLCDAVITPLIQGDAGEPLWMGRKHRTATDTQRRALVARDRGCAFPDCHRPAPWTQAHHINDWQSDGLTDIDNMCLLCTTHHTLIHKPGWHAKLAPDQTLEVTTPTGRVLRAPPRTHVHQCKPTRRQPDGDNSCAVADCLDPASPETRRRLAAANR
jgi:hypothetical protein